MSSNNTNTTPPAGRAQVPTARNPNRYAADEAYQMMGLDHYGNAVAAPAPQASTTQVPVQKPAGKKIPEAQPANNPASQKASPQQALLNAIVRARSASVEYIAQKSVSGKMVPRKTTPGSRAGSPVRARSASVEWYPRTSVAGQMVPRKTTPGSRGVTPLSRGPTPSRPVPKKAPRQTPVTTQKVGKTKPKTGPMQMTPIDEETEFDIDDNAVTSDFAPDTSPAVVDDEGEMEEDVGVPKSAEFVAEGDSDVEEEVEEEEEEEEEEVEEEEVVEGGEEEVVEDEEEEEEVEVEEDEEGEAESEVEDEAEGADENVLVSTAVLELLHSIHEGLQPLQLLPAVLEQLRVLNRTMAELAERPTPPHPQASPAPAPAAQKGVSPDSSEDDAAAADNNPDTAAVRASVNSSPGGVAFKGNQAQPSQTQPTSPEPAPAKKGTNTWTAREERDLLQLYERAEFHALNQTDKVKAFNNIPQPHGGPKSVKRRRTWAAMKGRFAKLVQDGTTLEKAQAKLKASEGDAQDDAALQNTPTKINDNQRRKSAKDLTRDVQSQVSPVLQTPDARVTTGPKPATGEKGTGGGRVKKSAARTTSARKAKQK